jgi:transposase
MAAGWLVVRDELWEIVEPLVPSVQAAGIGRPRVPDRTTFWRDLVCVVHRHGVEADPARVGLLGLDRARALHCVGQGRRVRAPARRAVAAAQCRRAHRLVVGDHRRHANPCAQRGDLTGPSRGRPGSKHHAIVDSSGVPLAVSTTGGNRHDVTQLVPLIDAIARVTGKRGRPRQRPDALYGDRGYDFNKHRRLLWARGVKPVIARRGAEHGSGLGNVRCSSSAPSSACSASAICAPTTNDPASCTTHSSCSAPPPSASACCPFADHPPEFSDDLLTMPPCPSANSTECRGWATPLPSCRVSRRNANAASGPCAT